MNIPIIVYKGTVVSKSSFVDVKKGNEYFFLLGWWHTLKITNKGHYKLTDPDQSFGEIVLKDVQCAVVTIPVYKDKELELSMEHLEKFWHYGNRKSVKSLN